VINFVKALYADLDQRIDLMVAELRRGNRHADIEKRFIEGTIKMLTQLQSDLVNDLSSGVLELETALPNNLLKYNKSHRAYKAIHSYRFLALKNYGDAEVFLFRLITRIYDEHRLKSVPPIVSTISNQDDYYWAHPFFEIIALPSGEEKSLLNLPDLTHEIGHLLYDQFLGKCVENSRVSIEAHYDAELLRVYNDGLGDEFKSLLTDAQADWDNAWIVEFACDLIGTYMTGGAYAWTNLKIVSTGHGSAKIYQYYDSHPADEARMRIIIMMLEKLGLHQDAGEVQAAWDMFLQDTKPFEPANYELVYPDTLLKQLVDEVYQFFHNADLASYPELKGRTPKAICEILNDAWHHAQNNPFTYQQFEQDRILELKVAFGLPAV
jgi:hypothetical protein